MLEKSGEESGIRSSSLKCAELLGIENHFELFRRWEPHLGVGRSEAAESVPSPDNRVFVCRRELCADGVG